MMITPVLTQLRPDHQDDLAFLFKVCGSEFDPTQPFNPDTSLIAIHEGQIVGFITAWIDDQPYAWVDVFLVHPDFRRGVVGFHLASAMRAIILEKGARAIRCASENGELTAMLKRIGFTERRDAVLLEWRHK